MTPRSARNTPIARTLWLLRKVESGVSQVAAYQSIPIATSRNPSFDGTIGLLEEISPVQQDHVQGDQRDEEGVSPVRGFDRRVVILEEEEVAKRDADARCEEHQDAIITPFEGVIQSRSGSPSILLLRSARTASMSPEF